MDYESPSSLSGVPAEPQPAAAQQGVKLSPLAVAALILSSVALFFSPQLFTVFDGGQLGFIVNGVLYYAVALVAIALVALALNVTDWRSLAPVVIVTVLSWPLLTVVQIISDYSTVLLTFTVSVSALLIAVSLAYLATQSELLSLRRRGNVSTRRRILGSAGVWGLALLCSYVYVEIVARFNIRFLQPDFFGIEAANEIISRSLNTAFDHIVLGITVCLIVPVAEELIFRYINLGSLRAFFARGVVMTAIAVIVTSLLFTGIHVAPHVLVPIFLLSLAISYAYIKYGFYYAVAIHAAQNTLSFGFILLVKYDLLPTLP